VKDESADVRKYQIFSYDRKWDAVKGQVRTDSVEIHKNWSNDFRGGVFKETRKRDLGWYTCWVSLRPIYIFPIASENLNDLIA